MKALIPIPDVANEASFIVRVEMHGASWPDYQLLHERMKCVGFHKRVVGDDGRVFELPDAEYFGVLRMSYERVRDTVQIAANSVCLRSSVLVTEAVRLAWTLPLVG